MDPAALDRRIVPWLAIAGGVGLALWSAYWDLRRRVPRRRTGGATSTRTGTLGPALALLAVGWLGRYAADRWGAWLAVAGYGATVAGITLLAAHVAGRLSEREPEAGGD